MRTAPGGAAINTLTCEYCGKTFKASRARFCSNVCRAQKSRASVPPPPALPADEHRTVSGLVDAVRAELESGEVLNSVAGQHALELANRIVNAPGMNAGVASLSKQLQAVLAEAMGGSKGANADPMDELEKRRLEKLSRAAS